MSRLLILAILLSLLVSAGVLAATRIIALVSAPFPVHADPAIEVRPAALAKSAEIAEFKPREIASYSGIIARPVFFEGRRTPRAKQETKRATVEPPTAVTAPLVVIAADRLKLNGVRIDSSGSRALVTDSAGVIEWRREDDGIDGWTLTAIRTTEITLQQGGQTATLRLYENATSD